MKKFTTEKIAEMQNALLTIKRLMMESASYLRSRCIDGIHNLEIQRIRNRKVNMFQVLGDVLGPVYSQKQFS